MASTGRTIQIEALLERVPLLSRLDDAHRQALCRLFVPASADAGEMILLQGEPVRSFLILCRGEMVAIRRSPEGRERVVAVLKPGMHFGLAEMITNAGSAVTLRAEKPSLLAVLNHDAFRREVLAQPALCFALMQTMARTIFRLVRELDSATFESVPRRLARTLRVLADAEGVPTAEGLTVFQAPTHQDLANLIGASRETVTRALAQMRRDGLIDVGYRQITVKDRQGLKDL